MPVPGQPAPYKGSQPPTYCWMTLLLVISDVQVIAD